MLSLMKKDLDVLTKQYKMYVILLVFFLCAGSVSTTDEFFSTFPIVLSSWFTASLIACDEREGFVPESKKLYVQEKYLFQLAIAGLSLIITVAGLCGRYTVGGAEFCNVLLTMLAAAFLVPAAVFPLIFKLTAAKATLKYLLVLAVAVGVCYYFSAAFEYRYIAQIGLPVCIGAGIAFAAVLFLSYKMSVKHYEKREN